MSLGRYALDTVGASLGAGVGVFGAYLLTKYGHNKDVVGTAIALPFVVAAGALGGLALGEALQSRESPLPARTVWPATKGFFVGAVIDVAALGIAFSSAPPNDNAALATGILSALTIGSTTVAGYSLTR